MLACRTEYFWLLCGASHVVCDAVEIKNTLLIGVSKYRITTMHATRNNGIREYTTGSQYECFVLYVVLIRSSIEGIIGLQIRDTVQHRSPPGGLKFFCKVRLQSRLDWKRHFVEDWIIKYLHVGQYEILTVGTTVGLLIL
jgi:hypothetical protein